MRRSVAALLSIGTFGVVLTLGQLHALHHGYRFVSGPTMVWALAYAGGLCLGAYAVGLPDLPRTRRSRWLSSLAAIALVALAISMVQLLLGTLLLPRFVMFGAAALLLPGYTLCATVASDGRRIHEERDRVLVVGAPASVEDLGLELDGQPERFARIVGQIAAEDVGPGALTALARSSRATVVVLDRTAQADETVLGQVAELHLAGTRIRTLSLFYEEWLGKLPVGELERVSMLFDIGEIHRAHYVRAKRVVDLACGLAGLGVLLLVTPFVLAGNALGNRGPLLYRQERIGRDGRPFWMVKFRSMRSSVPWRGRSLDRGRRRPRHPLRWLPPAQPPRRAAAGLEHPAGRSVDRRAAPRAGPLRRRASAQASVLRPAPHRAPGPHRLGAGEVPVRRRRGGRTREAPVRILLPAAAVGRPRPADHRSHAARRAAPGGAMRAPRDFGGRITVCHVITKLTVGGAQETVLRICAGLDRSRWRPLLVTGPEVGEEGDLFAEAEAAEVPVAVVRPLVRPISPTRDAAAFAALVRIFRQERPAIVHTHSSKAGLVGRAAALVARTPAIVHTQHGWALRSQSGRSVWAAYRVAERALARRTDRIVVVADRDCEVGLRHGIGRPEQYAVVRSGVDLGTFASAFDARSRAEARRRLGLPLEAPVVGAVTRLAPVKDPANLIRAFAVVLDTRPAARLVLVGDGPLRAECEALVARLGMAERVHFAGVRRDVADLMAAFDVTALSSVDEGLPRTVLESMAAGVPVVATRVGGVPEVVVDGATGVLVPSADAAALAAGLGRVLDDPAWSAGLARAARSAIGDFDAGTMVRRTEALYDELAGGR